MDPAYYIAAGSLKARAIQLESLASNLVNTNTIGYKTERTFFSVFNKAAASLRNLPLSRPLNDGTVLSNRGVDYRQGNMMTTAKEMDLAIEGNAFFVVQGPDGQQVTRDGRFRVGREGELATLDGAPVLGKNEQTIKLNPKGGAFTVTPDGTIHHGGLLLGQLELKAFKNATALVRVDHTRFDARALEEIPVQGEVIQGNLEESNADTNASMIEMIRLHRLFEMSMKVASTITNDLDARTISDVASGR